MKEVGRQGVIDAKGRFWACRHTDSEKDPESTISLAGWCPFCGGLFHSPWGFERARRNRNEKLRDRLRERDGNTCWYCFRKFCEDLLATIDHVWPQSLGGDDSLDNLRLSCPPCNQAKGNRIDISRGDFSDAPWVSEGSPLDNDKERAFTLVA